MKEAHIWVHPVIESKSHANKLTLQTIWPKGHYPSRGSIYSKYRHSRRSGHFLKYQGDTLSLSAILRDVISESPDIRADSSLCGLLVTWPYAAILIERGFGRGTMCSRMNLCHSDWCQWLTRVRQTSKTTGRTDVYHHRCCPHSYLDKNLCT